MNRRGTARTGVIADTRPVLVIAIVGHLAWVMLLFLGYYRAPSRHP
jgi:hypothetical protein